MARMICTRSGIKPDGKSACDAFDKEKWICIHTGACELQEEQIDDATISTLEHVDVSSEVSDILDRLKRRPDLFEILGQDIYLPVKEALKIIDKTSHLTSVDKVTSYWENSTAMEFDMGKLSSISVHIDVLASKMEGDAISMNKSLNSTKSSKFVAIKRSYNAGLRATNDRITDKSIEHMVEIDDQIKELTELALKTGEIARVFRNFYKAIIEHIQVMKKRIDSAREEKRNAKYTPG